MKQFLQRWKLLNFRKLIYLPYILAPKEKFLLGILVSVIFITGAILLGRAYLALTYPVPKISGKLREALVGQPRSINPIYASVNDTDRELARLIFSGLVTYSGRGKIINDLAEAINISEDGKIYTVRLKDNLRWHDGKKLTADDVVFTIKTIQNPQYKSPIRVDWQGVEVEKINDREIKFVLKTPYTPFIENFTVGILPKHLWETVSPERMPLHELNLKPIGSGPYKFDSFEQAEDGKILRYRLKRNPNFHRRGPFIKEIEMVFYDNISDAIADWRKGLIDGLGPLPKKQIPEFKHSTAQILELKIPRVFGIFLNERNFPAFSEKAVRQALNIGLNRDELTKRVTSGAIPSVSPFPFPLEISSSEVENVDSYIYNPTEAAKILEKSGWIDRDKDGIREKEMRIEKKRETVKLEFTLKTVEAADLVQSAELIRDELKELGIKVNLEILSFSDLENSVIRSRDFQALLFGHVYGHEPDPFAFWHSSQSKDPGLNITFYSNKKADELLETARKTNNVEERNKKYVEFLKLFKEDLPAIFLYRQLYIYALPANVKGVDLSNISLPADRFNEINSWYLKTKRVFRRKKK